MRKLLACVVLVSLLWTQKTASAQDAKEIDLSLYATYWDVKDGDDNVWGPGLAVAFPIYENQLKLDFRATWLPDVGEDRLGDIQLIPLDLGLSWHYNCNEPWDAYVLGGASWIFADTDKDDGVIDADLEDDTAGGYVGAGVRYDFADNVGLFTNVYYRFAEFDIESDLGDFDSKFDVSGLNVDVGFAVSF